MMSMNRQEQSQSYSNRNLSFLVRIWQEGVQSPWRASVQVVRTGETIRFAELAALFAFLGSQTTATAEREGRSTSEQSTAGNSPQENEDGASR